MSLEQKLVSTLISCNTFDQLRVYQSWIKRAILLDSVKEDMLNLSKIRQKLMSIGVDNEDIIRHSFSKYIEF